VISFLNFEPKTNKLKLLYKERSKVKLYTATLVIKGYAKPKCIDKNTINDASWIATKKHMFWGDNQNSIKPVLTQKDSSDIESFSISCNGDRAIWATKNNRVYLSDKGQKPKMIGYGKDPSWHPYRDVFIYSAAGYHIDGKIFYYKLKIDNAKGSNRFISSDQLINERWPIWTGYRNDITYTADNTNNLYMIRF